MKNKYKLLLLIGIMLSIISVHLLPIGLPLLLLALKKKVHRLYILQLPFVGLTYVLQRFISLQLFLNNENRNTYILYDASEPNLQLLDALSLFEKMIERKIEAYYVCNKAHPQYKLLKSKYGDKIIRITKTVDSLLFRPLLLAKTKAVLESFGGIGCTSSNLGAFVKRNREIDLIFIQHGVNFFKEVYISKKTYHKKNYDKILVSNDSEKEFFKKNGGFSEKDFIKAGLPRWDYLNKKPNSKKIIFVYFTYRKTFIEKQNYRDSKYYKNLMKLLNGRKLNALLEKENVTLNVALHHTLCNKEYSFKLSKNITLVSEFQIDKMKRDCNMLITDYSSMSFEFLRQDKPVIFYHLDKGDQFLTNFDKSIEKTATAKNERIFNICEKEEDVLKLLQGYVKTGFKLEKDKKEKCENFFYDIPVGKIRDSIINQLTNEECSFGENCTFGEGCNIAGKKLN
jgi:hypothetical protein